MNYPMLDDGTRDWCRTCIHYVGACETDCNYQRNENGPDYDKEPTMYQQKPMSNYDRIRAKSVEEMAEFFAQQEYRKPVFDGWLPLCNYVMWPRMCHENGCEQCWLDWLKQEVEE